MKYYIYDNRLREFNVSEILGLLGLFCSLLLMI